MIELSRKWLFEEKARGRSKNPSEPKSIVLIAAKYDLDPMLLIDAIVEAYRDKTQRCGSLEISYRGEKQDSAMFLLTEGEKVVSQFPVRLELIINPNFLKNLIKDIPMSSYLRKEPFQKQKRIDELKSGMKKINVDARIVDIPPRKLVTTEFGNQFYVSNVKIADDTGSIRLSLWNGQIEKVHVGDKVEIENCYVSSFAGEQQLRIGRNGMISVM
ncbi:hypothetical protein MUP77_13240 [Candidatus Bathyarchaeota archaeon]|nr:hypothetical protein [Candidatus Bathyarchaeota archaeon]